MKKLFYTMGALLLLASCTKDYKDWTEPQVVKQPTVETFTAGGASVRTTNIDFNVDAESDTLLICTIDQPTSTNAAYKALYTITLGTDDNAETFDFAKIDEDGKAYMLKSDFVSYVEKVYGKAPTARSIPAVVHMWLDKGEASVKMADSAPFTVNVKLSAPFIDEGYWLVGDMFGWNAESAQAFTHVGEGNVYDAPTFTITFTTTADNQYWKIIPQNNYAGDFWKEGNDGVVGTVIDGDESMEGNLTTTSPQAGKIAKAGMYRMTIDMMNFTYKLEALAFEDFIYVPGNGQGWNPSEAAALYSANNDGVYTGYAYIDGNFKFTKHRNWNDGEYNWDDFTSVPDTWSQGDGTNINCPEAGVFYLTVDVAANTIEATKIEYMGVTGDYCGWNEGAEMTWNAVDNCYVLNNAEVTANGWKFRANGLTDSAWKINLGANDEVEPSPIINDLVGNGKNISAVGTTIKLYPLRNSSDKIYCTVE